MITKEEFEEFLKRFKPTAQLYSQSPGKRYINEKVLEAFLCKLTRFIYQESTMTSFIHPKAWISPQCKVGKNCRVGAGSMLGVPPLNLKISEGRRIRTDIKGKLIVEDDVDIGCNCVLNLGVDGNTIIRNGVFIGHLSSIGHDAEIGKNTVISAHVCVLGRVRIGEWSYIAPQTVIRNRVTIGDYTFVGMGSVVTKNIPSSVIAYGNPCKVIKENVWKP